MRVRWGGGKGGHTPKARADRRPAQHWHKKTANKQPLMKIGPISARTGPETLKNEIKRNWQKQHRSQKSTPKLGSCAVLCLKNEHFLSISGDRMYRKIGSHKSEWGGIMITKKTRETECYAKKDPRYQNEGDFSWQKNLERQNVPKKRSKKVKMTGHSDNKKVRFWPNLRGVNKVTKNGPF